MRRLLIAIESGDVAAIEMGPAERKLDLLFLHANGFCASAYVPILAPLGGLRILAVDLRGHGMTRLPTPLPHPGWRLYAEDLLAVLRVLGEVPRVLAGHSMGGTTALLAAPEIAGLGGLVLFDPVIVSAWHYARAPRAPEDGTAMAQAALRRKPGFATREEAFAAYRGRGAFRSWPDETLRGYLEDGLMPVAGGFALSCAPAWEAANFASYAMDDPTGALGSVGVPIRILRAGENSTCVLAEAPGAHVRIDTIAGSSHFLPMERPEVVGQALKEAVLF